MASPFTPFPTFGGDKQGGGIATIKMNPAQVRFPTPRFTPQRRPLEPTTKEKFAPLAPFLVGGIMDMFKGQPETLSDDLYLESINADPTNPSKVEQASLDAYKLYGPQAEPNNFGIDEVVNILAAGSMDRGAPAYATTYLNKRTAEAKVDAANEVSRAAFIKEQLKDKKIPFENYINTTALEGGFGRIERTGYTHPDYGLIIHDPENPNAFQTGPYKGYVQQEYVEGNYVKSGTYNEERIKGYTNPDIKSMMEGAREFNAKDAITFDTILTINDLVSTLETSEGEPIALAGGALAVLADDIDTNLSAIANSMGLGRNPQAIFSTSEDGGNFKGTGTRIAELKSLTDQRKETLQQNNNDPASVAELDALILEKYTAFHSAMDETGDSSFKFNMFDEDLRKKGAFERVSAMSDYISLGYLVAGARFGQTGRTLSDKDLAFALQSIGFGATQNKEIAKALLLKVGNAMIDSVDTKARYTHNPLNYSGLTRNDNYINAFSNYWQPPTNDEGVVDWDSDPKDWKYINLEQRAINRLGENEDGTQINPIKRFKSFESDLFNVNEYRAETFVPIPGINEMQQNLIDRIKASNP